jgi:hypothetical protein
MALTPPSAIHTAQPAQGLARHDPETWRETSWAARPAGHGAHRTRLAKLAKAFDLKVVATRRDASRAGGEGTRYGHERLAELLAGRGGAFTAR